MAQQPPPGAIPLQPGQQPPPGAIPIQLPPGQQITPEQAQQIQQQIAAEAAKRGLTPQQFLEQVRQQQQAMMQQQAQMRQAQMAAQQGGGAAGGGEGGAPPPGQQPPQQQQQQQASGAQPGQQVPIQPGPPKPEALALASFLRAQDLKLRTCIFQEKRKDMFRVKRAIRSLQSEAYGRARAKNPLLPAVTDRVSAENVFKLLPMSLLALRVQKADPHAGGGAHGHGKAKRVKGLWTVQVVPQQEAHDDFYYVWLYEGSQWRNKLYAIGALLLILAVVFFPVWPYHLRLGVWYLSMGMLGLLGLFFAMAIVRLILFLITVFTHPPGLWLYPNLFEDVGFFDSFKPLWAWHEDEKAIKKRKKEERDRKKARREARENGETPASGKKAAKVAAAAAPSVQAAAPAAAAAPTPEAPAATGAEPAPAANGGGVQQRSLKAQVEEVEDE